jgi:transposase
MGAGGVGDISVRLRSRSFICADRGHDADWFRDASKDMGIKPYSSCRKSHGKPVKDDKRRYDRRGRIEIMFCRLKDWCRAATRYDRCGKVFLSAVAFAATVMFWPYRENGSLPQARPRQI